MLESERQAVYRERKKDSGRVDSDQSSVSVSVYVRSRTNPGIYTPGERARI